MSKPIIALDVDDVLVNFNETVLDIVNKKYDVGYVMEYLWWNFTNLAYPHYKYANSLFDKPEVHERLELLDGAAEFVDELASHYEIVFVTSVFPNAIPYRDKFLKDKFKHIDYSVVYTNRKDLVYSDVMVDDSLEHVMKSNSKVCLLVDKPWNQSKELLPKGKMRVKSFADIMAVIKLTQGGY